MLFYVYACRDVEITVITPLHSHMHVATQSLQLRPEHHSKTTSTVMLERCLGNIVMSEEQVEQTSSPLNAFAIKK